MSERPVRPSPETLAKQAIARDPEGSVWVAANAGSGKTHVLTERVLRLLLSGAAPDGLLCLTYTKAAAAEMRARVSARLAGWALMDDPALAAELAGIEGRQPGPGHLAAARTLFARALETPGGLKINTIHAFAESLLHRFPLEAGVPFDFAVIEEARQAEMIAAARDRTVAEAIAGNNGLGAALDRLYAGLSDHQIEDAIARALGDMRKLRPVLGDAEGAKARLKTVLGMRNEETRDSVLSEVTGRTGLSPALVSAVLAVPAAKSTALAFQGLLGAIDLEEPSAQDLFSAFLTKTGQVPKTFPPKEIADTPGGLDEPLKAEAERLAGLYERLKTIAIFERSTALTDILLAIVSDYERQKRAEALMDFDDLIAATIALLRDTAQSDWVRYKLDQGIVHILVDESQDTNSEQWELVRALGDEFFAGDSAVERPRTVFSVGDPKQSIFSFQGAEPALFPATGRTYARKAEDVGAPFATIDLQSSFRTLPRVLEAVDAVFREPALASSLLSDDGAITHDSARAHPGGVVTLWPPVPKPKLESLDHWPLPQDIEALKSAPRQLAESLVGTIKAWLDAGRILPARGRPVRPDDFLILVQSRNGIFREIVRALKTAQIPSPGADRLAVGSHIAILDLLALGDVVLNPQDDLGLAALLRSPLFDFTEDDLFALAAERGEVTLWQALEESTTVPARDAFARLSQLRARRGMDRPYEFFAHVLYAGGGLRRFHARLGPEVDDVLAEFLDLALAHEQATQPGLQGFLAAMRARDTEIKRELGDTGLGVRVMTVHGAKGLEAPVTILADAGSKPSGKQKSRSVFFGQSAAGPYLVHVPGKDDHVTATAPLHEDYLRALDAEYWRKLYVAMTRAEDELHVCAIGEPGKLAGTWYDAVEAAISEETQPWVLPGGLDLRVFPKDAEPFAYGKQAPEEVSRAPLALAPLPSNPPLRTVTPSGAGGGPDPGLAGSGARIDLAGAPRNADQARREGLALHALLQHLPAIAPGDRQTVGQGALAALLPELSDRHGALLSRACAILDNAALGHLFGPQSRAEVPVLAAAEENGEPVRIVGRIDRLAIGEQKLLILDYKSDARVPATPQDIPPSYVRQLALYALALGPLYPHLETEAAILWTAESVLMPVPADQLARAGVGFCVAHDARSRS